MCSPRLALTGMERALCPPTAGSQWDSYGSCALCQRRRPLHSSKMLRRMNEAGEAPVTVGFKVWRVLAGPLDLGSVSPWNCALCHDIELGLC